MRFKEFWGQGDQGTCTLNFFLTKQCLPNLSDVQTLEHRPVRIKAYLHVFSPTHTATNSPGILRANWNL